VLTLAVQQRQPLIALSGAALAHAFASIDAYNAFQYGANADRVKRLEDAFDARDTLTRVMAPKGATDLRKKSEARARDDLRASLASLGNRPIQQEVQGLGRQGLAYLAPVGVFRRLYPGLIIAGAGLAVWMQWRSTAGSSPLLTLAVALLLCSVTLPGYVTSEAFRFRPSTRRKIAGWRKRKFTVPLVVLITLAGTASGALAQAALRSTPISGGGKLVLLNSGDATARTIAVTWPLACRPVRVTVTIGWDGIGRRARLKMPKGWISSPNQPARSGVQLMDSASGTHHVVTVLVTAPAASQRAGQCRIRLPEPTTLRGDISGDYRLTALPSSSTTRAGRRPSPSPRPLVVSCGPSGADATCATVLTIGDRDRLFAFVKAAATGVVSVVLAALLAAIAALGRDHATDSGKRKPHRRPPPASSRA
jgi:hypothetical protein